ncbi:MAG: succinyldiaminopimelate transaminase [Halomonadaceae bacterium]|nr:MAG: succinyldiaminopimelate transaminase [Halomonadaceae bacterium]
MNPDLERLQPYPFEKLATLFRGITPPAERRHIALSIGEPKHPAPAHVLQTLQEALPKVAVYPSTKGLPELRQAIAGWANQRFNLDTCPLDSEQQVLPVNGTREALFAIAQTLVGDKPDPLVICPNPFYQIYEGAAFLAGATPWFVPCRDELGGLPDYAAIPDAVWQRCELLFLCSPGNPNGAVMTQAVYEDLLEKADHFDFVIAADECYSELYPREGEPPLGLLQACASDGRRDFSRCLVFHSLSKRSNLPGLRSGFVAGDATLISQFLRYRTYHGCAMPTHHQLASISAWQDEAHVVDNRAAYRSKFEQVIPVLAPHMTVSAPEAGFYLWPQTPMNEETFARELFAREHVTVLPGSYLSRTVDGFNPGSGRVRMALVAPEAECLEAAQRIARFIRTFNP